MRSAKLPWVVLAAITAGFTGVLIATADALPAHVATHFDIRGRANGWMPREVYIWLMVALGLGESLFVALLAYCTRFLPTSASQSSGNEGPKRLSPSQRAVTHCLMTEFGAWLGCVGCLFALGLHLVILVANRADPPAMPGRAFALFLGAFLALLGAWIFALVRRVNVARESGH